MKNMTKMVNSDKLSIKSGEQYLLLISKATTKTEYENYTKLYNEFLAKRQKEVIDNEHY